MSTKTCWSMVALLKPIISDSLTIISADTDVYPVECSQRCIANSQCDLWSWRLNPDATAICGLFYNQGDYLDITDFEIVNMGSLALSQWIIDCDAEPIESDLNDYFITNLDLGIFEDPTVTTPDPSLNLGILDDLIQSGLRTTLEPKVQMTLRYGVDVLVEERQAEIYQNLTPIECEWMCTHEEIESDCLGFTWTTKSQDTDEGECRIYDECPDKKSIYQAYKIENATSGVYGIPISPADLSNPIAAVGPGAVLSSSTYSNAAAVTGLDSTSCQFPDEMKDLPISTLEWVAIGSISALAVGVFGIALCGFIRKRSKGDFDTDSILDDSVRSYYNNTPRFNDDLWFDEETSPRSVVYAPYYPPSPRKKVSM